MVNHELLLNNGPEVAAPTFDSFLTTDVAEPEQLAIEEQPIELLDPIYDVTWRSNWDGIPSENAGGLPQDAIYGTGNVFLDEYGHKRFGMYVFVQALGYAEGTFFQSYIQIVNPDEPEML